MGFVSELDPPHIDLVWQTCHDWLIKTHTTNEYVCATCGVEVIGADNMGCATDCRPIIQTRKWLPSTHPSYNPPLEDTQCKP